MKRITALAALTALLATSATWAAVPSQIGLQGVLRDGSGNPVPDGSYSATFKIYDAATAGSILWTESQSVSTLSGLFSTLLGSSNTLPDSAFNDTARWLGVTVSPDPEMSPRLKLVSGGYSYRVNSVEGANGGNIFGDLQLHSTFTVGDLAGDVGRINVTNGAIEAVRMDGTTRDLKIFGDDVLSNLQLLGTNFGEIQLRDGIAANVTTAILRANQMDGGELILSKDTGGPVIDLDARQSGDLSVKVPPSAINAVEMLNEPGVASDNGGIVTTTLDGTIQTLLSRSLNAPTSGYVLAIATGQVNISHTNGATSNARFGVSDAAGSFPGNQTVEIQLPSVVPGAPATYRFGVTVHGLFQVSVGNTTFYFLGDEINGSFTVGDMQLSLAFFPTNYGTVEPTFVSTSQNLLDGGMDGQAAALNLTTGGGAAEAFNVSRLERKMTQIRVEMEALGLELEKQKRQNEPAVRDEK